MLTLFFIPFIFNIISTPVHGQYVINITANNNPVITSSGTFATTGSAQLAYDNSNTTCATTDGTTNTMANTITLTFSGTPFVLFNVYMLVSSNILFPDMAATISPITASWGSAQCSQVVSFSTGGSFGVYTCSGSALILTITIAATKRVSICNFLLSSYDIQWATVQTTINGLNLVPFNSTNHFLSTTSVSSPQNAYDSNNGTCTYFDSSSYGGFSITFIGYPFTVSRAYISAPSYVPTDMYSWNPSLTVSWGGSQCIQMTPFSLFNTLGVYSCSGYGSTFTITSFLKQAAVCNIQLYSVDPQWIKTTNAAGRSGDLRNLMEIIIWSIAMKYLARQI